MKINLIFFLSEFVAGGAGNSIFRLCCKLPKKRYQVSVISLNKCFYKNELKKIGVNVYEIASFRTLFGFFKLKSLTKKIISKNLSTKNIFLSNINYSNVLTMLFLRNMNMKICLIERTPLEELSIYYNFIDFFKKNVIKFLIRLTYKNADLCIANSNYISKKFNEKYKLKFKTIFPPSFDGKFKVKKRNHNKSKIRIVTTCRLSKEKGILDLIIVIKEMGKNYYLDIIGDGPDFLFLKNMRDKLKLQKNIKFLGYIKNKKIKKKISKYDLYINNSDFEGFPNTVVEAISVGVPVLASQSYGGINEIINEKRLGFIYQSKNQLKKKLNLIYRNKLNFKINKQKTINHLKKFSAEKNLRLYDKVFLRLVK